MFTKPKPKSNPKIILRGFLETEGGIRPKIHRKTIDISNEYTQGMNAHLTLDFCAGLSYKKIDLISDT
jgi:hypothetical protein